jgi:hypothetical protein
MKTSILTGAFPDGIGADREAGHRPLDELDTLAPTHSFMRV